MIKVLGEKIYFRDHVESDFDFYHSWRSNPEVMKFLEWRSKDIHESRKSFDEALTENLSSKRKKFFFAVLDKKYDKLIGECGFTVLKNDAELGYFFMPEYWGKGYASEATALMIEYCFNKLNLKRVVAECSVDNISSESVMKKSGMRLIEQFEKEGKKKVKYEIISGL